MKSLLSLLFILLAASVFVSTGSAKDDPLPQILRQPVCLPGQGVTYGLSGGNPICEWPADEPRFGCPDQWILVTRGGKFESCTPKADKPEPSPIKMPETPSLCADGEVLYSSFDGPRCAPAFTDAGQACKSPSDCEGYCLGDTDGEGQCAAAPFVTGCTNFLGLGGKAMAICVD